MKLKRWLVGTLAVAAAIAGAGPLLTDQAQAQEFPLQPVVYLGTVTVSSGQDPNGLLITARVLDYESEPAEVADGKYVLSVLIPDKTYAGETVTFHLEGVPAEETDTSVAPGGLPVIKTQDLTFPSLPEATPTPTATPTAYAWAYAYAYAHADSGSDRAGRLQRRPHSCRRYRAPGGRAGGQGGYV